MKSRTLHSLLLLFAAIAALSGCAGSAASAEEYFSIGMAYFDMGKFEEAEKWLNRARAKDRTMTASDYNLGRIAFETGRFEEAAKRFESILKRDPDNIMALKAAAYSRIRNGDIEKAEELYGRLLTLVPESADDGYNYALVLFAMKKYPEAEEVLQSHEFALLENNDVLLLYARTQKEQDKVEAIDSYAAWLANNSDARVRYEYAQLLEDHELYARALEEYRTAHAGLSAGSVDPTRQGIRFLIARLLLIAEKEKNDGITELRGAVTDGFDDTEALEKLLDDQRISAANRDEVRTVITEIRRAAEAEAAAAARAAEEAARAESSAAAADDGEAEADGPEADAAAE